MSSMSLWWLALALGAVVTVVVATLLRLVLTTARGIGDVLEEIWVAGPRVANNTAHLDLVRRIAHQLQALPDATNRITKAAATLVEHAHGCPGCPMCVTGWDRGPEGNT